MTTPIPASTCAGEPKGVPAVAPIPVYACKIEDDAIWVDMDPQLNDAAIPHRPYH
jgi:3-phenylpropionate/trans-cinnamate dioxygenase ferredoxin subunit